MITENQLRQQIYRKIRRIPLNKLNELNDYIGKLENLTDNKKNIMSFAGCWNDIDESVFEELTDNLISKRNRNNRRINE